jgi:hypothetical protein
MSSREPRTFHVVEDRWATFRHVVEAFAIVAAGLWAFYTFVYQEKIKPAGEPAALVPTVSIERLGRDSRRDILNLTIRLQNSGKTEIDIAADAWSVLGERFADREMVTRTTNGRSRTYSDEIPVVSTRLITTAVEFREAAEGGPKGRHIVIEPGASEAIGAVIVVPRGAYDMLHAEASMVPVKTSIAQKVRISVVHDKLGAATLNVAAGSPAYQDNVATDFALIP